MKSLNKHKILIIVIITFTLFFTLNAVNSVNLTDTTYYSTDQYFTDKEVKVKNVTFDNARIILTRCNSTFEDTTFKNMKLTQKINYQGGQARILNGSAVFINCTFINSEMTVNSYGGSLGTGGAGIYAINATINIQDSVFKNLSSTPNKVGGAIYLYNCNSIILNTLFDSNLVDDHGSAIYATKGNISINKSNFTNNVEVDSNPTNSGNSGTICLSGLDNVVISSCKFINNSCSGMGGAIGIYTFTNIIIDNCWFENNTANSTTTTGSKIGQGGAIGQDSSTTWLPNSLIIITNSIFKNNYATSSGGAIHINAGTLLINNCQFINNTADTGSAVATGGALNGQLRGTGVEINQSNFTNNNGNTLSLNTPKNNVLNCNFFNNRGISINNLNGATYIIKLYLFQSNFVNNTGSGSVISGNWKNMSSIYQCNFENLNNAKTVAIDNGFSQLNNIISYNRIYGFDNQSYTITGMYANWFGKNINNTNALELVYYNGANWYNSNITLTAKAVNLVYTFTIMGNRNAGESIISEYVGFYFNNFMNGYRFQDRNGNSNIIDIGNYLRDSYYYESSYINANMTVIQTYDDMILAYTINYLELKYDIQVKKINNVTTIYSKKGDYIKFIITIFSDSDREMTNVYLYDSWNAALIYVNSTESFIFTNDTSGYWFIGTLNPNQTIVFEMIFKLNTEMYGSYENLANATYDQIANDTNHSNNYMLSYVYIKALVNNDVDETNNTNNTNNKENLEINKNETNLNKTTPTTTNDISNENISENSNDYINTHASMKSSGIPIFILLLLVISGIVAWKKRI